MSARLTRLLWLDQEVRDGTYPAVRDLCERFAIAERTAYEDLAYLRGVLHAPLRYRRKHGGYAYETPAWQFPAPLVEPAHAAAWAWLLDELTARLGEPAADEIMAGFVARL